MFFESLFLSFSNFGFYLRIPTTYIITHLIAIILYIVIDSKDFSLFFIMFLKSSFHLTFGLLGLSYHQRNPLSKISKKNQSFY